MALRKVMLDERKQKMLGVYTMVVLIDFPCPFPDHATMGAYSLIPEEYFDWLDENVTLIEEGSLSPSHIKYAIVSVDGCHYRVVYVDRGNRLEYSYTERVVGTPVTTYKWETVDE